MVDTVAWSCIGAKNCFTGSGSCHCTEFLQKYYEGGKPGTCYTGTSVDDLITQEIAGQRALAKLEAEAK